VQGKIPGGGHNQSLPGDPSDYQGEAFAYIGANGNSASLGRNTN